jgi:hypothetical protein
MLIIRTDLDHELFYRGRSRSFHAGLMGIQTREEDKVLRGIRLMELPFHLIKTNIFYAVISHHFRRTFQGAPADPLLSADDIMDVGIVTVPFPVQVRRLPGSTRRDQRIYFTGFDVIPAGYKLGKVRSIEVIPCFLPPVRMQACLTSQLLLVDGWVPRYFFLK